MRGKSFYFFLLKNVMLSDFSHEMNGKVVLYLLYHKVDSNILATVNSLI